MRPLSLEIHRFRGWGEGQKIALDGPVTLVVGDNGVGKSSTLDAVGWCLYGGLVEAAKSGIAERKDWEARNRQSANGPAQVTLTLGLDDPPRRAVIQRARPEGASSRADELRVELRAEDALAEGTGRLLRETEAQVWIAEHLPDWATYRRAHAQHQSAGRARLLDPGDRSAVLELLLGLDDDARLREGLGAAKVAASKFLSRIDGQLREIEEELDRELGRGERERREVEARIAGRGFPLERIGRGLIDGTAQGMTSRALSLNLALTLDLPLPSDGPERAPIDEVIAWAEAWPKEIRSGCAELEGRMQALRTARRSLADGVSAADARRDELARAESGLLELRAQLGDAADVRARVAEARRMSEDAQRRLGQANVLADLLARARDLVARREETSAVAGDSATGGGGGEPSEGAACPVCGQSHSDLVGHIDGALAEHDSDALSRLAAATGAAASALDEAERQLAQLEDKGLEVEGLRGVMATEQRATGQRLVELGVERGAGDARHPDFDPLAAARNEIERLDAGLAEIESALNGRDAALSEHDRDLRLLRDLREWLAAKQRAQERVDVTSLEPWAVLQRAVDEAAAFASDQEVLASFARDAQVARSEERAEAVNANLGHYLAAILGDSDPGTFFIHVHQTATKIDYRLQDERGDSFVAFSNQAKLNAVSLALLFAQAEAQARAGELAWAIIDDPVQSMDGSHQHGLARAIEQLATHCSVLVSATWSDPLVTRIREHFECPRRIVKLAKNATTGTVVLDGVDRL